MKGYPYLAIVEHYLSEMKETTAIQNADKGDRNLFFKKKLMDVAHDVFRAIFEVTRGTRMNFWTTRSLVYLSLHIMVGVCHHSPQIKSCITMIVKSQIIIQV